MPAVRVVQMVLDQIIDMIAVRHRFVAAARSMHVPGCVPGAAVIRGAALRVGRGDLDHVLIDVIVMRVVEMPVVQRQKKIEIKAQ